MNLLISKDRDPGGEVLLGECQGPEAERQEDAYLSPGTRSDPLTFLLASD
jgi:hypothetical protein